MNRTALFLSLTMLSGAAFAGQFVGSYIKSDGTFVSGYTRSSPDAFRHNNLGSKSNGGSQRDEYSSGTGATNRSNASWGWRDNDSDGVNNPFDRRPNSKRGGW